MNDIIGVTVIVLIAAGYGWEAWRTRRRPPPPPPRTENEKDTRCHIWIARMTSGQAYVITIGSTLRDDVRDFAEVHHRKSIGKCSEVLEMEYVGHSEILTIDKKTGKGK